MPPELLKANSRNSDIRNSCLTVRPTDADLQGVKAEVGLDMSLSAAAGFVVFTPKALSIPVLQKILESMLLDEADEI